MVNCFSCFAPKKKTEEPKEMLSLEEARAENRDISNSERHLVRYRPTAGLSAAEIADKINAQSFTFHELADATQNFHSKNFLGQGSFGRVYKGMIRNPEKLVAVKQLGYSNKSQENKDFLAQVFVLSVLSHPNLVDLIGYCSDGKKRLLVYEYMPLCSLDRHLFDITPGCKPLSWYRRMQIALDVALGLQYLHEKVNPPMIYRDLKCSNILLDQHYNAKLSDFGLAKFDPTRDNSTFSSRVMNTYGYCSPEYLCTGEFSTKSDIYSYGVFMLELITGKAVDSMGSTEEQGLLLRARPMYTYKQRYTELVDPRLEGRYPEEGLTQAVRIAIWCSKKELQDRPIISDVILALSHLIEPPDKEIHIDEQWKQ